MQLHDEVAGCDGMGTWRISGVVRVSARAPFGRFPDVSLFYEDDPIVSKCG